MRSYGNPQYTEVITIFNNNVHANFDVIYRTRKDRDIGYTTPAKPIYQSTLSAVSSNDEGHYTYQDSFPHLVILVTLITFIFCIIAIGIWKIVFKISRPTGKNYHHADKMTCFTVKPQSKGMLLEGLTTSRVNLMRENYRKELKQIKFLLVGPTGSGKSSTGNTILGKSCFEVGMSSSGVTQQCTKETADRFNRRIEVVDTPGFSNITGTTWKTAWKHPDKVDVVLLVLDLSRFTYDIERKVKEITANLGEDIFKIMFIVFTREDELHRQGMSIEDYVNTFPAEMSKLQQKCNNRIKCINNVKHGSQNTAFVEQLVEDIEILWATDKCTV